MKKSFIISLTLILWAGSLFSCSENKASENEEVLEWDSIVKDTTIHLTEDIKSPTAEIHLNIKYALGKQAKTINDTILKSGILSPDYLALEEKKLSVEEAINLFITKYLADYKRDFAPLYQKDSEHTSSYNLQYSCNTTASEDLEGVINYIANVYNYSGGAFGMNFTVAKNISKSSAKVLKLGDFFVSGYEEELKEIVVKELCKKFEVEDLDELRKKNVFYGIEPYLPENFIATEDEIVFIYCDTEIAPHSVGEIRLAIEKKELQQLLKKES